MYINGLKYACSTCIKGHRSSHCNHSDRPLLEIRKKGRPISQCSICRDLRKTKQVHIKCACNDKKPKEKDTCVRTVNPFKADKVVDTTTQLPTPTHDPPKLDRPIMPAEPISFNPLLYTPSQCGSFVPNSTCCQSNHGESVIITITPLQESSEQSTTTRIVTCYCGSQCTCPGCLVHPNNYFLGNPSASSSCCASDEEDNLLNQHYLSF